MILQLLFGHKLIHWASSLLVFKLAIYYRALFKWEKGCLWTFELQWSFVLISAARELRLWTVVFSSMKAQVPMVITFTFHFYLSIPHGPSHMELGKICVEMDKLSLCTVIVYILIAIIWKQGEEFKQNFNFFEEMANRLNT